MYGLYYTHQAKKDYQKLKISALHKKVLLLLEIIRQNPYQNPPPYERLGGRMQRAISRRINIQHRLVYEVNDENNELKILRMWTHYE